MPDEPVRRGLAGSTLWPGVLVGSDPISVTEFVAVAAATARALADWHERQGVHGRLHPDSVLVEQGEQVRVRIAPPVDPPVFAYLAPEQVSLTGRGVDERTDLYALGVMFYESLFADRPFQGDAPLAWLARHPTSTGDLASRVPELVTEMVLRLLAKAPQDRYQTARGLAADLERCWQSLCRGGELMPFPLCREDRTGQLVVSGRLYGRQQRLSRLIAVFDRVAGDGRARLVCLAGDAGVGKSALAAGLASAAADAGGWVLAGRFGRDSWAVPYAGLAQALSQPFALLRAEPAQRLATWRDQLRAALGESVAAVADLVPASRPVLDQWQPAATVPPRETANRVRLALRRCLAELAGPDRPLVLVLDDLQWADAASLRLLDDLLADPAAHHLLVIGTYRPKEVGRSHPLRAVLNDLRQRRQSSIVPLRPLPDTALAELLADTLHTTTDQTLPLAQVVARKTGSNPLLVGQFLHTLQAKGMLRFEEPGRGWTWRLNHVRQAPIFDSPASAVSARVGRLDSQPRRLLTTAALIGDQFDLSTLAAVVEAPVDDFVAHLRSATREHLLVHVDDALALWRTASAPASEYRWLHDEIRQATLSLVPAGEAAAEQRAVERVLGSMPAHRQRPERVYELPRHPDAAARRRRPDTSAQLDLAGRALLAGLAATRAGAPEVAHRHLASALDRLPAGAWTARYDLALALHAEAALSEAMAGNLDRARGLLGTALAKATTDRDRAELLRVRVTVLHLAGDRLGVTEAGLAGLARAGLDLPRSQEGWADAADTACRTLRRRLAQASADSIVERAAASAPTAVVAAQLIADLLCYGQPAEDRSALLAAEGVRLALEHGPTAAASVALAYFGITALGSRLRDDHGAEVCMGAALRLLDDLPAAPFEAPVRAFLATALPYWYESSGPPLEQFERAYRTGLEHGDARHATLSRLLYQQHLLASGAPLARVAEEVRATASLLDQYRLHVGRGQVRLMDDVLNRLRGLPSRPASDPPDPGGAAVPDLDQLGPDQARTGMTSLVCRIIAASVLGDHAEALRLCQEHEALIWDRPATFLTAERYFYHALALVAANDGAAPGQRRAAAAKLATMQMALDEWSARGPRTFGPQALLVSAERARLAGDTEQAMGRFDRAIGQAKEFGAIHVEALAAERAWRCAKVQGELTEAAAYLRRARACYQQWGADAKVEQIDRELTTVRALAQPAELVDQLDLHTVVRAFQSISSELELDKVLAILLELLIQHAGAERGCLLLPNGDGLRLAAEAEVSGDGVAVTHAPGGELGDHLPISVVQYTQRTRELVTAGAEDLRGFAGDRYLAAHRPRSLLCAPISRHQQLVAVLYLEHRMLTDVFTPGHLSMLELLCAQAAVALENATIHTRLAEANRVLDATLDELPFGLILLHPNLTVRRASVRAEQLCGMPIPPGTPLREVYLATTMRDVEAPGNGFWAVVTAAMVEPGVRGRCHLEILRPESPRESVPRRLEIGMSPLHDEEYRLVGLMMTVSEQAGTGPDAGPTETT